MKGIHRLFLMSLICVTVLTCFTKANAQPEPVSAQDISAYINKARQAGERFGATDERYVLDNFNRPELVQTIQNWQRRSRTILMKDIKIRVIVDYLLTELKGLRILPSVLDSLSRGESTSFGQELKTQVATTTVRQYQFGRIQIEVNLSIVDVQIDNKSFDQVQNGTWFSVEAGQPHVVIIRRGSSSCNNTVSPGAGRTVVVPCTLR